MVLGVYGVGVYDVGVYGCVQGECVWCEYVWCECVRLGVYNTSESVVQYGMAWAVRYSLWPRI